MPIASYYDILEVSPKASAEVIRAAYKSLMQRHHPDKSVNGTESTPLASSIAMAYEVLSDPQRRIAYDQTLLTQQGTQTPARRSTASKAVQNTQPQAAKRLSAWYTPVLILSIIVAGGAILVLSKKTSRGTTDSSPTSIRALTALAPEKSIAVTDEGQIRTISAFVTDLSIELNPDPAQSAAIHVLHIPSMGLRLATSEPDRWTLRIQAQRPQIIQQLLITLAAAKYPELIKPDGDLYLKRLIEESVIIVTGLDKSSALPIAGQPSKDPQPLQALLPVSFSVQ